MVVTDWGRRDDAPLHPNSGLAFYTLRVGRDVAQTTSATGVVEDVTDPNASPVTRSPRLESNVDTVSPEGCLLSVLRPTDSGRLSRCPAGKDSAIQYPGTVALSTGRSSVAKPRSKPDHAQLGKAGAEA